MDNIEFLNKWIFFSWCKIYIYKICMSFSKIEIADDKGFISGTFNSLYNRPTLFRNILAYEAIEIYIKMQIRIYCKREIHIIGKCISFLYIYMKIIAMIFILDKYGGKKNERKIIFKDQENYFSF